MNKPVYPPTSIMAPGDLVEEFIRLRNNKREAEAKFEEFCKEQYGVRMAEIEQLLLAHFHATKTDNLGADTGTAYRYKAGSATIADKREFMRHVIGTESWELADWRANKPAVEEYVEKHQATPPGVNYSAIYKIGVRSKGKEAQGE